MISDSKCPDAPDTRNSRSLKVQLWERHDGALFPSSSRPRFFEGARHLSRADRRGRAIHPLPNVRAFA
jgi:hypothetical protein